MSPPVARSPGAPAEEVAVRLAAVRRRIEDAGGDPARVEVVAVTKGFGVAAVRAALSCGLRQIGENYADELVEKAVELAAWPQRDEDGEIVAPAWHFLGAVQRNKLARLAPHVSCYEALDRLVEGEGIARRAPGAGVLVEVDTTGEGRRPGVAPSGLTELVAGLRALDLEVLGLMTVAPPGGGAPARAAFAMLARLADELGLAERSMGMSDDLELAVAAGATSVRIGRALFGARPSAAQVPQ